MDTENGGGPVPLDPGGRYGEGLLLRPLVRGMLSWFLSAKKNTHTYIYKMARPVPPTNINF